MRSVILVATLALACVGCGPQEGDEPEASTEAMSPDGVASSEQAVTYYPKCVVASSMSVFSSSTGSNRITTIFFGETFWATRNDNGRYYGTWWQAFHWHWGYISADPRWTNPGECKPVT